MNGYWINNRNKYIQYMNSIPYSQFVDIVYIEKSSIDCWVNVSEKFPKLLEIEISQCYYYKKSSIVKLLSQIS